MPKNTYSQLSIPNREPIFDSLSVRMAKKKTKIHKKKFRGHHSSSKFNTHRTPKKQTLKLRYKSAYSPEYIVQLHDLESSSFHSDQLAQRCPHSQDQIEFKQIETLPFAEEFSVEVYRRFQQDYQKRDLERIMRSCKVTEEANQNLID